MKISVHASASAYNAMRRFFTSACVIHRIAPERKRKKMPSMGKLLENWIRSARPRTRAWVSWEGVLSGPRAAPDRAAGQRQGHRRRRHIRRSQNRADGVIALGWKSGVALADLKTAAGDAALGVELPADAGAGALKEAQDAGAEFILAPLTLRARALLDEAESSMSCLNSTCHATTWRCCCCADSRSPRRSLAC